MRIVHTADWHLCDRLGRLDRTDGLRQRVEAVAKVCEDRSADVLLIAGDLFSEQASVDAMTAALLHLRQTFLPSFARGGTVLAVTDNHNRNSRIDIVRAGMGLAVPDAGRCGRRWPTGCNARAPMPASTRPSPRYWRRTCTCGGAS
jgi:exonuclease SbcD